MKTTYLRQYELFLTRLKTARKEAGITQRELAKRLGKPQSYVSKYENGERRLDVVEFLYVTKALEIGAGQLLDELADALEVQVATRRRRVP